MSFVKLYGSPELRQASTDIEAITDATISLSKKMKFVLSKLEGWGLAANQIGICKNIFVYNLGSGYQIVINPQVKEYGTELWEYWESCLSLPGFSWEIARPRSGLLSGMDIEGNQIELEATDVTFRLFLHERDHLQGKLILDLLSESEREKFNKRWRNRKKR